MIRYLDNINDINRRLEEGQVVLCPTDTIWGLSCDAHNPVAVEKIFKIKNRSQEKKCILLVHDIPLLKKYVINLHPRVETLLSYHKAPLTVIHQAAKTVPRHLVSEDGTIAVRVTHHKLLSSVIAMLGRPIISTSANMQGEPSPLNFSDISEQVKNQVDLVFQYGRESKKSEGASRIIKYDQQGELVFLR